MSIKQKVCSYYLGRKVVFLKWILVVSVVIWLVSILFSVQNVRGGFTVVVLMCLGRSLYYRVGMSLSAVLVYVYVVGHNCSVEEKLEFKICDNVLQEVGKFCYLGYMIMVEYLRQ